MVRFGRRARIPKTFPDRQVSPQYRTSLAASARLSGLCQSRTFTIPDSCRVANVTSPNPRPGAQCAYRAGGADQDRRGYKERLWSSCSFYSTVAGSIWRVQPTWRLQRRRLPRASIGTDLNPRQWSPSMRRPNIGFGLFRPGHWVSVRQRLRDGGGWFNPTLWQGLPEYPHRDSCRQSTRAQYRPCPA